MTSTEKTLPLIALSMAATWILLNLFLLYKKQIAKILSDFWLFFSALSPWAADNELIADNEFLRSEAQRALNMYEVERRAHLRDSEKWIERAENQVALIFLQRDSLAKQADEIKSLQTTIAGMNARKEIVAYLVDGTKHKVDPYAITTEPHNTFTKEDIEYYGLTFRPLTYAD